MKSNKDLFFFKNYFYFGNFLVFVLFYFLADPGVGFFVWIVWENRLISVENHEKIFMGGRK